MFGRVRPSSISSLELLELERSHSKIIKDDSLSIYETTLLILKQGSHRSSSLPQEVSATNCAIATGSSEEQAMAIDSDCSSADSLPSPDSCSSTASFNEQRNKNMSILHMFSRYKSSQRSVTSPDRDSMLVSSDCSSIS